MPTTQSTQLNQLKQLSQPQSKLDYCKAIGRKIWTESQTKYLALAQALSGVLLYVASELNDVLHNDMVKEAMGQLTLPKWFPFIMLTLAVLTYIAHGHNDAERN